jgi:DNA-binding transcriptional regulator GbsR (MarR family)
MHLTPTQSKFILHWGEMGQRWGINRTVAQIHALLFVSPEPLNAEQIAETLSVARSNVSTSLRELQGWGIAKAVHRLGDRREFFETQKDVWEMYEIVMDERKKREIDPTVVMLRECVAESAGLKEDKYTHQRLSQMLDFVDTMSGWYDQLRRLPRSAVLGMAKMGSKLGRFLGAGKSP